MQNLALMKAECEVQRSRIAGKIAALESAMGAHRKTDPEDKDAPLLRKGESPEKIKKPLASLLGLVCTLHLHTFCDLPAPSIASARY